VLPEGVLYISDTHYYITDIIAIERYRNRDTEIRHNVKIMYDYIVSIIVAMSAIEIAMMVPIRCCTRG